MNRAEALLLRDRLLEAESRRGLGGALRGALPPSLHRGPVVERPPIAIGISGAGENYRLAVRLREQTVRATRALEQVVSEVGSDIDLLETGPIRTLQSWQRSEIRPLAMGASCAHRRVRLGTLGCFVRKVDQPARVLVLSNNHVLAREDRADPGDNVLQPARGDQGGDPANAAALFSEAVPLVGVHNEVDAAVAAVRDLIEIDSTALDGIGSLSGVRHVPLDKDDPVHKVGRTTFTTTGRVGAIGLNSIEVRFPTQKRFFDNVIEIVPGPDDPFSDDGDSGSLVVDENRQAVGLLFAKSEQGTSYANPIQRVLELLGIELIP